MAGRWHEAVVEGLIEAADRQLGSLVNLVDTATGPDQGDILERATLTFADRSNYDGFGEPAVDVAAILTVSPADRHALTDATIDMVMSELRAWVGTDDVFLRDDLVVQIAPAAEDWREQRREARQDPERAAKNQARNITARFTADGFRFESQGELAVYRALKRLQGDLPPTNTIGIIPGPGLRTVDHSFWPDLLVTYGGKVGGIEVDSPHNTARAAADHTRDRLIQDVGIRYTDRVPVEDTNDPDELSDWARKFLDRLTRS